MVRLMAAAWHLKDYANLLAALADNLPVRGVELMQESGEVKDLADSLMKMAGEKATAGRVAADFDKARE
ncbi:MAG: hypothetical protein NC112_09500 [Oxalobacter formigenes]|nr:hypothetical protein [Oxalobacter formigenes]